MPQVTKVNGYEKLEPMVNENGIYLPEPMMQPSGNVHTYKLVMTKEQFIKAYHLYILSEGLDP